MGQVWSLAHERDTDCRQDKKEQEAMSRGVGRTSVADPQTKLYKVPGVHSAQLGDFSLS
jgi:hypothetical protein